MIDAMKQALEALEELMPTGPATAELRTNSINALRQAIEQAEKQPSLCVCVESIKPHPFKGWEIT
jgi:hypothetical protein